MERPERWGLLWLAGFVVAAVLPAAVATAEELTLEQAIALALERNPGLAAAVLELEQAEQAVRAEEDLYPFILAAEAAASRVTAPVLAGTGVNLSTAESVSLTTGLRKSFPIGTSLSLDVTGTVDRAGAGRDASGQPAGFGLSGRFTLVQPLLRGFGTRVGEASLRQARLARTTAARAADRAASELLRDVVHAYFELWYATRALAIQEESRELAARQLQEVEQRISRGTLAPVEALSFATALASREEEVASARDARRRAAIELLRLLGAPDRDPDTLVAGGDGPPPPAGAPAGVEDVAALARQASHRVKEAAARADLAREQARVAGEDTRPRLDLSAWLEGRGLGNDAVWPAFRQLGAAEAGGAFVGLSFEMPLTDRRRRAEVEQARLAARAAEQEYVAATQQVEAEAAAWVSRRDAAASRVALAARTEEMAARQVAAERRRYEVGTAIAIEVQQAEDALRLARLRAVRALVDLAQAEAGIDHLTGRLLERARRR